MLLLFIAALMSENIVLNFIIRFIFYLAFFDLLSQFKKKIFLHVVVT